MVSLRFRGDFMPACVCTWEQTTRACLVWGWYPIINGSWLEGDADQLGSVLGAWGLMVKPLTKSRQASEGFTFGGNIPRASVKTAKCGREMWGGCEMCLWSRLSTPTLSTPFQHHAKVLGVVGGVNGVNTGTCSAGSTGILPFQAVKIHRR